MMNPNFQPPSISDCSGGSKSSAMLDPLLGSSTVSSSASHCMLSGVKNMDAPSGGQSTSSNNSNNRNSGSNPVGFWNCGADGTAVPFAAQPSVGLTSGYYCYDASRETDRKTAAFKIWPAGYDVHHHANTMAAAACQSAASTAMDMYSPFHHQAWPYNPYHHQAQQVYERTLHPFQVNVRHEIARDVHLICVYANLQAGSNDLNMARYQTTSAAAAAELVSQSGSFGAGKNLRR